MLTCAVLTRRAPRRRLRAQRGLPKQLISVLTPQQWQTMKMKAILNFFRSDAGVPLNPQTLSQIRRYKAGVTVSDSECDCECHSDSV